MKKIFCLCALISMCLLTGCTKNYKTVSEYNAAMKKVRASIPAYTIEVKQSIPMLELYYRSFHKGDKWKTETSMNSGNSYAMTTLYDGIDLLTYSAGSPFALSNPMMEILSKENDETKQMAIKMSNPIMSIFDWAEDFNSLEDLNDENASFIDNKANKNGFDCRMISLNNNKEVCINDKYGIAVYSKMTFENPKTKLTEEMELNVIKIDTTDLPESTFELPAGVKKQTLDKILSQFENEYTKNFEE